MTDRPSSDDRPDSESDATLALDDPRETGWYAVVEPYDDQPDVCTIFPTDDSDGRCTRWISAEAGSFAALEDVR